MTKVTLIEAARRVIAGRVFGPFRESGGLPGETSASRFDAAARAYLWNRHVRKLPAARALELAAPVALRPHTDRQARLWYGGTRGSAGAAFEVAGDSLRWIEGTRDAGLRFIAWADELAGYRHTGYYNRADGPDGFGETLRGGVWQLPGRKGRARLVYGYTEFEGRGEMNPGSAAICVSDILESGPDDSDYTEAAREAARFADGLAERQAERERDYDSAYQAGRRAAEADAEALQTAAELRPLLAELRSLRKSPHTPLSPVGQVCKALRSRVAEMRETISAARRKRDSAWDDCGAWAAEAWRAGFCDNAEGGFRRAVALGFARPSDWQGPAELNPCNAGAGE